MANSKDVLDRMLGFIMELPANPVVDDLQDAWTTLAAADRELRRDRARLEDLAGRRAVVLAFFRSVIHCREPWTDKCQLEYDAAMGGGEGEA